MGPQEHCASVRHGKQATSIKWMSIAPYSTADLLSSKTEARSSAPLRTFKPRRHPPRRIPEELRASLDAPPSVHRAEEKLLARVLRDRFCLCKRSPFWASRRRRRGASVLAQSCGSGGRSCPTSNLDRALVL